MKRIVLASAVLLVLLALGTAGCATNARKSSSAANYAGRPRAFALAVTVNGALQPTPQQWALIQEKFVNMLAARGWVLVSDITLADHIIRVDFRPNPNDPENSGHATILGVRDNPLAAYASTTRMSPFPASYSYMGSFSSSSWGWPYGFNNSFYGYGSSFYDGYYGTTTPATVVTTPPATNPPLRHHPGNRDNCPPELGVRPLPGNFAGNLGSTPPSDHPPTPPSTRPPPTDSRRWSGGDSSSSPSGRTYARSDSGYSRSDSSRSNSDSWRSRDSSSRNSSDSSSSYSRGDRSHTRSESYHNRSDSSSSYSRSEPSYSSSSYSSSSSSSSYSAPSSSSDSFSSSGSSGSSSSSGSYSGGGGSGTHDSVATRQQN